jgi:hypothetical protein
VGELNEALDALGRWGTTDQFVQHLANMPDWIGKNMLNPITEKPGATVDVAGVVKAIDKELAKANPKLPLSPFHDQLTRFRDDIIGESKSTRMPLGGPEGLHAIESRWRRIADGFTNSPDGEKRLLGGDLYEWRDKLVNAIDKEHPGYKDALHQYKVANDALAAFDKGANISRSGKLSVEEQLTNSPEAWDRWAKNPRTDPAEVHAAKMGSLAWMRDEIGSMAQGKRLMQSPKDPDLVGRMQAIWGKDRADGLMDDLRNIHRKAQTVSELAPGSRTAARQRGFEAMAPYQPGKGPSSGFLATLASMMPAAAGGAAELLGAGPWSGVGGAATLAGLAGLGARKGYQTAKAGLSMKRYMNEADRLTKPFSEQPELLQLMKSRLGEKDPYGGLLRIAPP